MANNGPHNDGKLNNFPGPLSYAPFPIWVRQRGRLTEDQLEHILQQVLGPMLSQLSSNSRKMSSHRKIQASPYYAQYIWDPLAWYFYFGDAIISSRELMSALARGLSNFAAAIQSGKCRFYNNLEAGEEGDKDQEKENEGADKTNHDNVDADEDLITSKAPPFNFHILYCEIVRRKDARIRRYKATKNQLATISLMYKLKDIKDAISACGYPLTFSIRTTSALRSSSSSCSFGTDFYLYKQASVRFR